jgi:protein DEK
MSLENTNTATRPTRERKQVERIVVEAISKEKTATEIPEGNGLCLSDYPFFLAGFEKLRTDDDLCKHLHHIMFGALGTKTDRKKSIRKFSGFAAGTDASEKAAKIVDKKGYNNSLLKDTLALFGLERSGTREQMAQRLVEYLQSPSKAKRDGLATPAKNGSKVSPNVHMLLPSLITE